MGEIPGLFMWDDLYIFMDFQDILSFIYIVRYIYEYRIKSI